MRILEPNRLLRGLCAALLAKALAAAAAGAVNRVTGRVPFLDPLSLHLGGDAGIAFLED